MSSSAQEIVSALLAKAGVKVNGSRPWDVRVHDQRFFARVLARGTLGVGESYMEGWWDCDALDEMVTRVTAGRLEEALPSNPTTALATLRARLANLQSARRAHIVGEIHYDLGNEFFAAMLGPDLQYSCAYFNGTDDLGDAQRRKMDLICRKLGLKPGMRLLDIGCGWGGFAKFAAGQYGCTVVGLTISAEQQRYAADACRGLPVEIRLQDYRTPLESVFDRVVSVGMMEHVGYKNYRAYMVAAARCLADGGLFLCHTIGGTISRVRSDPWIVKYVFPNSMLPSPAQVTRAAEDLFVLEDVHNLGPHYDRTLIAWERNFADAWPRFRSRYGPLFERMWRYYLLSCAGTFRSRALQLYQFVLAKGGVPGGYVAVR